MSFGRIRPLIVAAGCVLALGLASGALAQTGEQKEGADFSTGGVVEAVDAGARTITLKGAEGEGGTLAVDPDATIKNDAATIGLGDLKVGWRVAADGDVRDGKKVVTYLEVVETP